jgi:XTP/dITP diphosphohydrolase
VADDSGLEVAALGNRPGVHSKRWSGASGLEGHALDQANNSRLLWELRDVPADDRAAKYVCVAAYCGPAGEFVRRGEVRGTIIVPAGDGSGCGIGGFGYDPYFWCLELGRTFGEASLAEKSRVSHRARAFRAALQAIGGS